MVEKKESGIKKDFLYWTAIGIMLGLIIMMGMENQRVVDRYNNLAYEYNNNCRDLIPQGGLFELNTPVEVGLNDADLVKDEGGENDGRR